MGINEAGTYNTVRKMLAEQERTNVLLTRIAEALERQAAADVPR
jgi:hypothetical protein